MNLLIIREQYMAFICTFTLVIVSLVLGEGELTTWLWPDVGHMINRGIHDHGTCGRSRALPSRDPVIGLIGCVALVARRRHVRRVRV